MWLTLPVAPGGLLADAVAVVDATLAAGVELGGVNVMTMDYGGAQESLPAAWARPSSAPSRGPTASLRTLFRAGRDDARLDRGVGPARGDTDDRCRTTP